MHLDEFDFALPAERIAQHPVKPRDSARLLYVSDSLKDLHVSTLPKLLKAGDLLVFNDTKVIPSRLGGTLDGPEPKSIEITLHKSLSGAAWLAFAKPAKRITKGDRIVFGVDLVAEVVEKRQGGEVALAFSAAGQILLEKLHRYGRLPLPPYIKRQGRAECSDDQDYQTIFARQEGAVAAPTAGLHFTDRLLEELAEKGVKKAFLTLHVGAGTFLPIKTESIENHVMHSEYGVITQDTAMAINTAKAAGGRIIAVGTTSLRLLETAADDKGVLHPFCGETDIFIKPGYRFKITDLLLTNFHLPRSTLFILVCAFAGTARMRRAYQHAIAQQYRFYSYGDATLLEKA